MCFSSAPKPVTPAPPPPPPEQAPVEQDVNQARRAQDDALYGTDTPNLRVDRSATSGGVTAGGAGLSM